MVRPVFMKPKKQIAKRQLELRAELWPGLTEGDLWSRHTHDGFSTIPSTMPLIMSIMDDMSKGQPVSMVYLELWCRAFDEAFVTLSKARELAFHSGFTSQRAERTWKARLQILHDLGFINLKSGPSGPASYALILNPYRVIQRHHTLKMPGVTDNKYNALRARAIEIGDVSLKPAAPATDMTAPLPTAPNAPAAVPQIPNIAWPSKTPA